MKTKMLSVLFIALMLLSSVVSAAPSVFISKGFDRQTYSERFNMEIPTSENALKYYDHQVNIRCEWKRVYPETRWYLGVWNHDKTDCLSVGGIPYYKKIKMMDISVEE